MSAAISGELQRSLFLESTPCSRATARSAACLAVSLPLSMPIAPYLGAVVGVGITCFKNGLCYLPAYRKPWEHVIAGFAGAYAFQWIVDQEESMIKQIEDHYAELSGRKSA